MKRDEVLATLKATQAEWSKFGVRSVSIFGSIARDEATDNSDLDVLVEFEGYATFDGWIGTKLFLEDLFDRKIDLMTPRSLHPAIKDDVERELIRVA